MFGSGKHDQPPGHQPSGDQPPGHHVSTRLCTTSYSGKYPTVGLYDCIQRVTWVCKPLSGQAIRTSHARLITGADNATSTAWKDRYLCFWFYTPRTGDGYIHGYPIDWDEAHLLIRIDPTWDYDRQKLIPPELTDHVEANRERQLKHGQKVLDFFIASKLKFPFSLHYIGARAAESLFYYRRLEPAN